MLFPIEEKKMRNNADGHVLVVSDYEPGADYVYYWGFAWDARTSRLLKPGTDTWLICTEGAQSDDGEYPLS